jgi:VanZ family protein
VKPRTEALIIEGARVAGWVLAGIITVLSLVPSELRPETPMPHDLEHFSIFVVTGIAFGFGYSRRPFAVGFALVIFAGLIEIAQLFAPDRHATLRDFIVDSVALCVGVIIGKFFAARTKMQRA